MGYQAGVDNSVPPARIELRSITKSDFELRTPFAYVTRNGRVMAVPGHPNELAGSTDLASVPPLLWGLLPSYGRQLRAALLHDRLCDEVNAETNRSVAYVDRRRADDVFFEAMRDTGDGSPADMDKRVGWFRSKLFWIGVSYGRYWKFRRALAALLTVHVLVGVLAIDLLIRLPGLTWLADRLPWGWRQNNGVLLLVWIAAAVLTVAWTRDWQIPFIGLLIGPVILPVLLVTFCAQTLLGVPDWALHKVRPKQQPPANFGPTVELLKPSGQPIENGPSRGNP